MDTCNLSHTNVHELLTVMSIKHINDHQLKNAEKQLNLSITKGLKITESEEMVSVDPQSLLDLLVEALGITSPEVHVLIAGDGRTYGGRYN
jgi:hypothetical protein